MKKLYLLFLLLFMNGIAATAHRPDQDSSHTQQRKVTHWKLTGRIHNLGMFTYGGRIGSTNPAADLNFTLERPKWGLLIFKGMDLRDHGSYYNFTLVTVFKNFKLGQNITFTPYLGAFLEQYHGWADHGSDLACILTTTFKVSPHISLEHMSLLGNLVVEPSYRDWVNRFRLVISYKHLDAVPIFWYNSPVFDHTSYVTAGLNVAYSRVKVVEHLFLSAGVTGLVMLQTSNETANPRKNGFMITLGLQYAR